jgi:hypothetical protein
MFVRETKIEDLVLLRDAGLLFWKVSDNRYVELEPFRMAYDLSDLDSEEYAVQTEQ